jgi:hypothetical protein
MSSLKFMGWLTFLLTLATLVSCQQEDDAALALEDILVGQWDAGSGSAVVFYDETTGAAAGSIFFDTGGTCSPNGTLYTFDYEIREKNGLNNPVYFTYTLSNCNYNALYNFRPIHQDTLLFNPGGPGEVKWVRSN